MTGPRRQDRRHVHLTVPNIRHILQRPQRPRSRHPSRMLRRYVPCLFHQRVSRSPSFDRAHQGTVQVTYLSFFHNLSIPHSNSRGGASGSTSVKPNANAERRVSGDPPALYPPPSNQIDQRAESASCQMINRRPATTNNAC
jgi:hypothetical protein